MQKMKKMLVERKDEVWLIERHIDGERELT